jgi:hypothetical protein
MFSKIILNKIENNTWQIVFYVLIYVCKLNRPTTEKENSNGRKKRVYQDW